MKTRSMLNIAFVFISIVALMLSSCGAAATPVLIQVQSRAPTSASASQPTRAPAPTQAPAPVQAPAATPQPVAVAMRPGPSGQVVVTPRSQMPNADLPPESMPADMFFKAYGVNPMIDTRGEHLSTFAMDVDTASYAVMRRYINDGHLPPPEAVRVEEFVNYFNYDYASPENGAFAIHLEGAPSPFGEGYYLLRVGLQGRRVSSEQRKDAVLTFVIDVSGSMGDGRRLETVKQAMEMLVNELRPTDQVGIVVFSTQARVVLETTSVSNRSEILSAIKRLQPENTTNVQDGLALGYQMASRAFRRGDINHVILCSDGVANVGNINANAILGSVPLSGPRPLWACHA